MADNEITMLGGSPGFYDNLELVYDLAGHFFNPSDIDQLKVGQFGYSNAAMAKAITDNALLRNIFFQENFLNTASTPAAIITFAKQHEYDIGLANASSCRILVGFYLDDLKANLDINNRFILNKDNIIYLDDVEFLLPADVNIYITTNNSINVKYDLTNINTNENIQEFIRTFTASEPTVDGTATRTVIYCELTIYQLRKNETIFKVLTTNVMENTRYEVAIPEGQQLSFFKVYYKSPSAADYIEIPAYFNDQNPPTVTSEYCFYNYEGGTTGIKDLIIYFSSLLNAFRPEYNSDMKVEFYTTTGAAGNFNFTGAPSLTVLNSVNTPIFYTAQMITTPSAGRDRESLKEIKQGCLRKFLYRESIVIESDLELFLNDTVEKEKVNNSTVEFVKRRDDILTRLFGGYLLLKDVNNHVIPTNTVELSVDYAKMVEKDWVLKPGDIIIYDRKNDVYRLIEDYEYPTDYINDPNAFIYCVPFYIKVSKTPFLFASYIKNNVNSVVPVTTQKTYDSLITSESFIINNIQVERNSVFESQYLITCNISTNLSEAALSTRIIPRLYFRDIDNQIIGYTDLAYDADNNFIGTLITTDRYSENVNIIIENSIYDSNGVARPETALPENLIIQLELYFNSTGGAGQLITNIKNIEKDGTFYQLVQVHKNDENPINLFKNLDYAMFSKIAATTSGVFKISNVPLIGASFYLNTAKYNEIDSIVDNFQNALNSAFSLLQNNTSIDIKFFNTYGFSTYYTTDKTNLSIHLGIKVTEPSEDLKQEITEEIVNFINDAYNKLDTTINISNIITHLENTFPDIRYIHFYTVNGIEIRSITISASKEFLEQDNSRVPELINVSTKLDSQGQYVPDIRLDFI